MASRLTEIGVDCAEPEVLARFWCAALGYQVRERADDLVTIGPLPVPMAVSPVGPVPPVLTFARVPEGKTVKNRLHLDLTPTDRSRADEVRRLLDLGASRADVGQDDPARNPVTWTVLADPEGNEFCVLSAHT